MNFLNSFSNDITSFFSPLWCAAELFLICFLTLALAILPFIKNTVIFGHNKYKMIYNANTFSSVVINTILIVSIFFVWNSEKGLFFSGQFINTDLGNLLKTLVLVTAICIVGLAPRFYKEENKQFVEFSILVGLICLGLCCIISANDLMFLFLAIELTSLTLYILAASKTDSNYSSEAALKYFVLGAVASGIMILGISLVYYTTGSTDFNAIKLMLINEQFVWINQSLIGLSLICIGLLCKLAAAPFHMWAPDVYEGVPTIVLAVYATLPKIGLIAAFSKIGFDLFVCYSSEWEYMTLTIGLLSIAWGTFGGLEQLKIKRILAYSSISHVGFMIILLGSNSLLSQFTLNFYLIAYILTTIGVISFFIGLKKVDLNTMHTQLNKNHKNLETSQRVDELKTIYHLSQNCGNIRRSYNIIGLLLLSVAGIPPLIGFFAKFRVFIDILERNTNYSYAVGIIMLALSIISSLYYIRIIKQIFFKVGTDPREVIVYKTSWSTARVMALATVTSISFILIPTFYFIPIYSCTFHSLLFNI